jgi:hypothetical protein
MTQVTVTVKNSGVAPAAVEALTCQADGPSPTVESLGGNVSMASPHVIPDPPLGDAVLKTSPPPPLEPGHSISEQFFVIARDTHRRARLACEPVYAMTTPVLTLHVKRSQEVVLRPGCPEPLEWHAAVGQIGKPVTYLNYVNQQG